MTYYDKLNYFYSFNSSNKLAPATQLTYLFILHQWNCHRQVNAFYLSDAEIASSTHLGSKAITEAKRVLKNFGLIDFKIVSGRTKFFLPSAERCVHTNVKNSTTAQETPPNGNISVTEPNKNFNKNEKRCAPAKEKGQNPITPIESIKADQNKKREISPETKALVDQLVSKLTTRQMLQSIPDAETEYSKRDEFADLQHAELAKKLLQ